MGWVVNAMSRPLYPPEWPGTHCIRGWVGPSVGMDRRGKSRPNRDSIRGPSSPPYPGPPLCPAPRSKLVACLYTDGGNVTWSISCKWNAQTSSVNWRRQSTTDWHIWRYRIQPAWKGYQHQELLPADGQVCWQPRLRQILVDSDTTTTNFFICHEFQLWTTGDERSRCWRVSCLQCTAEDVPVSVNWVADWRRRDWSYTAEFGHCLKRHKFTVPPTVRPFSRYKNQQLHQIGPPHQGWYALLLSSQYRTKRV